MSATPFTLNRLQLKTSLYPAKGYRFKDSLGVTHVSGTLDGLITSLASYRRRLKLPEGEPYDEIVAQICKRQPKLCTSGKPIVNMKSIAKHVAHDLARQVQSGPLEPVSPEEVKRRTEICLSCPCSVEWVSACESCGQGSGTNALLKLLLASTKNPDRRLDRKCCTQARDSLALAVTNKNPRACAEAPENCWRIEKP